MPKIAVENLLQPGKSYNVDADKFNAMRGAFLKALPPAPGMTVKEIGKAVLPDLPQALFPDGEKAGWWIKCVQLDLEAKSIIRRDTSSPLRLFKV